MILTEETTLAAASLPLGLLKEHLRLGTGFSGAADQDALLEAYLRAAIAAVEGRTGAVLLTKGFRWRLNGWRQYDRQVLPVRPVAAVTGIRLIDRHNTATDIDPAAWRLEPDAQSPAIYPVGIALPVVPTNGAVEVSFEAGFGADWSDVPADLARAVLILAAEFYENRTSRDAAALPAGVLALLERFRPVRLGGR
ncbi:MAG: hypothetical protein AAF761_06660 [Pseudomonadota bacterium]